MHRLRFVLAHTWLALIRHDWTAEPDTQRRFRRWLVREVRAMEYDPHTQWAFHLRMAWFWIANFVAVTVWLLFFRQSWDNLGVFYVAIVSVYANFGTDFGAVHAAWAALRGDQIASAQGEMQEDMEEIHEHIEEEDPPSP